MRDLKIFKKKRVADLAFQTESQIVIGKDPGYQPAALPVDLAVTPWGRMTARAFPSRFFFPGP